jgi:hypothetical protein
MNDRAGESGPGSRCFLTQRIASPKVGGLVRIDMTLRANSAARTRRGGVVRRWRTVFHYHWHP